MEARIFRMIVMLSVLVSLALYGGMMAQTSQSPATEEFEIPLYSNAQLNFELALTDEDFLVAIQRLIEAFLTGSRQLPPLATLPPSTMNSASPEAFFYSLYYAVGDAFAQAFGEALQRLVGALREFHVVSYTVEQVSVAEMTDFYDQHFAQGNWRRNFWMREPDGMNGRLYSSSRSGRLRAATFIWIQELSDNKTGVTLVSVETRY